MLQRRCGHGVVDCAAAVEHTASRVLDLSANQRGRGDSWARERERAWLKYYTCAWGPVPPSCTGGRTES